MPITQKQCEIYFEILTDNQKTFAIIYTMKAKNHAKHAEQNARHYCADSLSETDTMKSKTAGSKTETATSQTKLSPLAESLRDGITKHGILNDKESDTLGIRTYKAQGELLHAILEPHKAQPLETLCKAFMELPAAMRDGIDYGRSLFNWLANGKPIAPTGERKAELRSKLSTLEQADAIRKRLFALANGKSERLIQIANMTADDLIRHEKELTGKA